MAKNVVDLADWKHHPGLMVIGAGLGIGLVAAWWHRHNLPRGWTFHELKDYDAQEVVTSDLQKLPTQVDAVVIGSGIGGLFCAALLAKVGKKVVVIEQGDNVGGCLHSFERNGYKFDVGLHYVGLVPERYGPLINLLCTQRKKVQWKRLGHRSDNYTYDKIFIGGRHAHSVRSGQAKFLYDLVNKFPGERNAIEAYGRLILFMNDETLLKVHFKSQYLSPFAQKVARFLFGRSDYLRFSALARRTVDDVVRELTSNEDLIFLLTAQHELAGEAPDELNFLCYALLTFNTWEGAYYPSGGPKSILKGLLHTILIHDGMIIKSNHVASITSVNGKVCGVDIKGHSGDHSTKKHIRTEAVFSSIGAKKTFKLVSEPSRVPEITIPDGSSHFLFFLGLRGSSKTLNLPSHNTWLFPEDQKGDHSESRRSFLSNPLGRDGTLQVTFPSAKDPHAYGEEGEEQEEKSTCVVLLPADPEWFKQHYTGLQKEDQDAFKAKLQERVMERLKPVFPQVVDNVVMCEVGTPFTMENYLWRHSSFGLRNTVQRVEDQWQLRPRTPIRRLYLCGQDVVIHGIPGSIEGAIMATESYLGYNFIDMFFWRRHLIDDLVLMHSVQTDIRPRFRVPSDENLMRG